MFKVGPENPVQLMAPIAHSQTIGTIGTLERLEQLTCEYYVELERP
jgi:hypothetical protein